MPSTRPWIQARHENLLPSRDHQSRIGWVPRASRASFPHRRPRRPGGTTQTALSANPPPPRPTTTGQRDTGPGLISGFPGIHRWRRARKKPSRPQPPSRRTRSGACTPHLNHLASVFPSPPHRLGPPGPTEKAFHSMSRVGVRAGTRCAFVGVHHLRAQPCLQTELRPITSAEPALGPSDTRTNLANHIPVTAHGITTTTAFDAVEISPIGPERVSPGCSAGLPGLPRQTDQETNSEMIIGLRLFQALPGGYAVPCRAFRGSGNRCSSSNTVG